MPNISIIIGLLLIIVGAVGYAHSLSTPEPSITALIPAFFGFLIMDLGILSKIKEDWRKHLMHAAVGLALLGFVMTAGRMVMKWNGFTMTPAFNAQLAMTVLCLILVLLGVRSFAAARADRQP